MSRALPRPEYMSRNTLAAALDCAESTVDELVKRKVIPEPLKPSPGIVRWKWIDVEAALDRLKPSQDNAAPGGGEDPYAAGVRNVTKIAESRRRAS